MKTLSKSGNFSYWVAGNETIGYAVFRKKVGKGTRTIRIACGILSLSLAEGYAHNGAINS
jgi:hypothetical protein